MSILVPESYRTYRTNFFGSVGRMACDISKQTENYSHVSFNYIIKICPFWVPESYRTYRTNFLGSVGRMACDISKQTENVSFNYIIKICPFWVPKSYRTYRTNFFGSVWRMVCDCPILFSLSLYVISVVYRKTSDNESVTINRNNKKCLFFPQ